MDGGLLQYRFDCGSGQGVARLDGININDGYWHAIVVERLGKNAKIIVDGMHTARGSAPGTNDVLNLDSADVFFGAEVITMADGRKDISMGFIGCIRDIIIDGVKLPLAGGSSVAQFKNTHNVEFHCRGDYVPGMILRARYDSVWLFLYLALFFAAKFWGQDYNEKHKLDSKQISNSPC